MGKSVISSWYERATATSTLMNFKMLKD